MPENNYILIIQEWRIGKVKTTRKMIVRGHTDAIEVIKDMSPHQTLLLFKPYIERKDKRRAKDRRK